MIRRFIALAAVLVAPFIRSGGTDGVEVTPGSGTFDVPPYAQAQTQTFMVKNTGTRTVDFSIQAAVCQPFELLCSWSTFSLNGVGPGESRPLTVTFTSGAPGWSGTISFVAKVNDNQSVAAGATITVRVPQQAWVETKSLNPGTTIERSHCVRFTVATNAASECGDLRIVHELPSLRVRSDDRTPVLIYNSAHADPYPVVRANISTPGGTAATNVTASLIIRRGTQDVTVDSRLLGTLPAASTRRVALGYSASGDPTGVYPYKVKVTMTVNGAARTDSSFDSLVVVNRANSPFGPGWWLAGLDERVNVPNAILIVGGDGSTRLFSPVDVNAYVFAAPAFDRPDTIVTDTVGLTGLYRILRHQAKTNYTDRHIATIDPLGFKTTFEYDANGRLTSIIHPGTAQLRHRFYYAGQNGLLDSVTGPGPSGGTRKVVFTRAQRGKITRITDADGKFVSFTYGSSTGVTITGRTNRNGVTQGFAFASNRVVQATLPLTATSSATSVFCPAEIRGLVSGGCGGSGPLDPAAAVSTIDGPRLPSDVNDLTTIAIDRYGGPFIVTDAVGNSTRLYRGNRGLPGLVTRSVAKNGWVNEAFYNGNGLIAARVEGAPLGPGRDAVTTYQWDTKWERVTQITFPEQNILRFAYDSLTGNRIWQEDGRGAASRVNFRYYASGGGDRLLRAAEYPTQAGTGDRDSVEYDANGNVAHIRQVSGNLVWTARHFVNDAVGRTTSACTEIDIAGNGDQQCQLRLYDTMDRDSVVTDSGPPMLVNGMQNTPAQTIRVKSVYDAEGNLTLLERSAFNAGVRNAIDTTQWVYDRANRRVKEIAGDGAADSLVYDLAGNTIRFMSRRTDPANPGTRLAMEMGYDALNRLTRRTLPSLSYPSRLQGIPTLPTSNGDTLSTKPYPRLLTNSSGGLTIVADTETFTYDEMGAIRTANNGDARVSRTYFANGLTQAETLKVRTDTGSDFSKHVYGVGYEYDLNGRRTGLTYPVQLTTTAGGTFNRVRYAYDAATGALASVTDQQNNVFTFAYDLQTRVDSIVLPGRIVRRFGYDGASRLINDLILNRDSTTLGHFEATLLRAATLAYNSRGDLLQAANAAGKRDTLTATYYGLGYLAASFYVDTTASADGTITHTADERFARDGLGKDTSSFTAFVETASKPFEFDVGVRNTQYQPGTGRQVRVEYRTPTGPSSTRLLRADSLLYDGSGNETFAWTIIWRTDTVVVAKDRASYYSADGRLRVVDHRTATLGSQPLGDIPITFDFDEHRYDALGRRVFTRTQRECVITTPSLVCGLSTIRRTVWDGSQELIEIQQPGHTGTSAATLENDTAFAARQPIYQPGILNADLNRFYGRVAYTVGPSLDQPLSVTRWAYQADSAGQLAQWPEPFTMVPHWNVRGEADNGAFADGSIQNCASTIPSRCVRVAWPFGWSANQQKVFQVAAWHGSLLEQKRDGSGLLFKRNRYLDPATGKFTQEDPIGLAGGLNLYGFANGDPVNFADPFGLFACPPDCGFEGDPRNLEREVEMVRSRTPRDVAFAVGAVGVATVGAFGVMAATSSAMALTMVATRLAPAGVAIGKGTEKLIDVLQEAGPGMDQRILAVSRWLPAGQRALMSSLEGGARMLSGGAGERARQIILNPNGETIIKALNVTSKTYEVIATIKPK